MLSVGVPLGGRIVTVHLHAGGIAAVYDPSLGSWELRKLPPESSATEVGNVASVVPARIAVPLSLVRGERMGTGHEVTAELHDWIRR